MKYLFYAIILLFLASCSSPKYTYHFDHYDYKNANAHKAVEGLSETNKETEVFPAPVNEQSLLATTSEHVVIPDNSKSDYRETRVTGETTAPRSMTREEKRELRKEAVKSVKEYVKAVKSGDTDKAEKMSKAMDADLRWAAIFGAVGIVSLIIGGDVFWVIGAAALIVATVFLVRYLIRQ